MLVAISSSSGKEGQVRSCIARLLFKRPKAHYCYKMDDYERTVNRDIRRRGREREMESVTFEGAAQSTSSKMIRMLDRA